MKDLDGKVALVTGAAKRVGAVLVRALHRAGADVVVHYRGAGNEAEGLRDELETARAGSVMLVRADLRDPQAPASLVAEAVDRWGRLDVVVNNASTFYPTKIGEVTDESWDDLLDINLRAPFFLVQAAAPHLSVTEGSVVNLVDIYADRPLQGFSVYNIAKAGLVMMTRSLARELGPRVRVNAVAPGPILWPEEGSTEKTQRMIINRTALKRQGHPDDLAAAMLYFVRDAPYVTGQVLAVDGGRSLTP